MKRVVGFFLAIILFANTLVLTVEATNECTHVFKGRTCTTCGYKKPLEVGYGEAEGVVSPPKSEANDKKTGTGEAEGTIPPPYNKFEYDDPNSKIPEPVDKFNTSEDVIDNKTQISDDVIDDFVIKNETKNPEIIILHINDDVGYCDGNKVTWKLTPKLLNNKTMVPLKQFAELLGGNLVSWDNNSKTATINLAGTNIVYKAGEKYVGGINYSMKNPAQIKNNTMYVELTSLVGVSKYKVSFYDNYCVVNKMDFSREMVRKYATLYYGADFSYTNKPTVVENDKTKSQNRIKELEEIIQGAKNAYNAKTITKTRQNNIIEVAKKSIKQYNEVIKGTRKLKDVTERKETYKAIVGSKSNVVKDIQQRLYDLDYTSQLVTGYYGAITFNNIAYFQIVNNINVTGWVDDTTYTKLFYVEETPAPKVVDLEELKWEEVENQDDWKDYISSSGKQLILGNFTDDVTVLGTALQIGTGIFNVDLPLDVRDVTADFVNWEWKWSHAGQTAIDIIAFVPVIGGIKYFDEAALLIKNGDELHLVAKHADEVGQVANKIINQFDDVVAYIKKHGKLPDNYITKDEAVKLGWVPKKGNLSDVAPGKSIGGDVYNNYERKLPSASGRIWYEADIDYISGYRNKKRLFYSNDGLFYKTIDHADTTIIRIGD